MVAFLGNRFLGNSLVNFLIFNIGGGDPLASGLHVKLRRH